MCITNVNIQYTVLASYPQYDENVLLCTSLVCCLVIAVPITAWVFLDLGWKRGYYEKALIGKMQLY